MTRMQDDGAYRFRRPVDVRFRDLDAAGHAHHTVPLLYFEEARAAYWREVVGHDDPARPDYVIAEAQVRYRARIRYPGRIEVGVRVSDLGRTSFTIDYELRSPAGDVLGTGRTVQVMYDYDADRSIPVPDTVRARIRAFEGG